MRPADGFLLVGLVFGAACGGEGGSSGVDGNLGGDGGTAGRIAASLPFATGETLAYEAPTAFDLNGGSCNCTGDAALGASVVLGWPASRTDAVGAFAFDGTFVLAATKLEPYARYKAVEGTVEITSISPGTIIGTFTASRVSLDSWRGQPPDAGAQLQMIASGSLECHGRSDGVYAMCFQ